MASKTKKRKLANNGIPFALGFQRPTERESERAIGLVKQNKTKKDYQVGENGEFFEPIPCPKSIDDWLAQYNEEGQNFKSFLSTCPWLSTRKRKYIKQRFVPKGITIKDKYPEGKIYLQPLGEFEKNSSPRIDQLAKYAQIFYDIPVEVLPGVNLQLPSEKDGPVTWHGFQQENQNEIDTSKTQLRRSSRLESKSREIDHRWHNGRIQLNVDSILKALHENIPANALCFIGLTMADLYQDPSDLFVAGMAYGNRKVAVFSFARYEPGLSFSKEFWYEMEHIKEYCQEEKRAIMLQRSCKLLVHEIAHLFGIDHCIWYSCCMNGSGHLEEDFAQPIYLCPVDLHKLQHLCGFDIKCRYSKLLEFFQEHDMDKEKDWIERRLQFITD